MTAARMLSRFLMTIAMLTGTVAWSTFTLQRTLFDTGRTEAMVDQLLDNTIVQQAMAQSIVEATEAALPEPVRALVSAPELTAMAGGALQNPAVRNAIENAAVDSHRYVIGESAQPPVLDTTALAAVVRQQFATVRPDLAAAVPDLGPIAIELPAAGLGPVKAVNEFTASLAPLLGVIALLCAAGGLAISPDRPSTLVRLGFWAVSLGATTIMLRYVLPAVSATVLGRRGVMVTGLATAASSSMAAPGTLMFGIGLVLITAGFLFGTLSQPSRHARPTPAPSRSQAAYRSGTTRAVGTGPRRSTTTTAAPTSVVPRTMTRSTVSDNAGTYGPGRTRPASGGPTPPSGGASAGPLRPPPPQMPQPPQMPRPHPAPIFPLPPLTSDALPHTIGHDPAGAGAGPNGTVRDASAGKPATSPTEPRPEPSARRWVEGVGYVDGDREQPAV